MASGILDGRSAVKTFDRTPTKILDEPLWTEQSNFHFSRPLDPSLGRAGRRPGNPGMATANKFATKSAEATLCLKISLDAPGIPEARQEFQSGVKNFRAES